MVAQGEAPLGRHEHAAVLVNRTMLVVGGRRSGRLMDDIQALNLESLKWTKWRAEYMDAADVPPNCAGHQMVLVNKKVWESTAIQPSFTLWDKIHMT